jgi:hypothetical protein
VRGWMECKSRVCLPVAPPPQKARRPRSWQQGEAALDGVAQHHGTREIECVCAVSRVLAVGRLRVWETKAGAC